MEQWKEKQNGNRHIIGGRSENIASNSRNLATGQFAATGNMATLQMIRKRVKTEDVRQSASVKRGDVFYDKDDGGYYTGMADGAEVNKTISKDEAKHYIFMQQKDRSPNTLIAAKTSEKTYIHTLEYSGKNDEYKGTELVGPAMKIQDPIAVRLYAEGNFDHARVLAETMKEERDFSRLQGLDGEARGNGASHNPVVIKGTEFDGREAVKRRYGKIEEYYKYSRYYNPYDKRFQSHSYQGYEDGREDSAHRCASGYSYGYSNQRARVYFDEYYDNGYDQGYREAREIVRKLNTDEITDKIEAAEKQPNLEFSFAGRTGDLTRKSKDGKIPGTRPKSKRKYDLIQSTFFWLPGKGSETIVNALIDYLKNQYDKLKENGLIRIILSNRNNPETTATDENQYKKVAEMIERKADEKYKEGTIEKVEEKTLRYMYHLQLIELKNAHVNITYAAALKRAGLNPGGTFKHTMTNEPRTVSSTGGDLMIQARKLAEEETAGVAMSDFAESFFMGKPGEGQT